ncbi:DNA cytosine methyltransferase [Herminiimonas sp. CN]|uniref:DNA cytosine methyltransferase n=1 Tax=Herminiimonas sp. CN TaxID=1349818 RepID=UPI000685C47B|nr:DNA cytosine methyltransferase [Herminiimonas sp. CN]
MNELALSAISLFSGVGMLDEGLRAGLRYLGIAHRTICHVEREAHAASVLVARMEEGSLDAAPIWSDVCTFDARAWRGKVDCIVAGFPCQDLSVAGRRAGLDGKRSGLFFEVVRIATDSGARFMLLENVAGIASATASAVDETSASEYAAKPTGDGFSDVGIEDGRLLERAASRVVGELADCGWDAEWIALSASDVGASHGRARWFCLAWRMANAEGRGSIRQRPELAGRAEVEVAIDQLGDAKSKRTIRPDNEQRRAGTFGRASQQLADASGAGPQGRELGTACNGNRGGRKHMDQLANFVAYSPLAQATLYGQESSNDSPKSPRHLNPLFGAWLMGWPSTWVIAEPHASSALETALWRSTLQQHLSCLLDEPEFSMEAA